MGTPSIDPSVVDRQSSMERSSSISGRSSSVSSQEEVVGSDARNRAVTRDLSPDIRSTATRTTNAAQTLSSSPPVEKRSGGGFKNITLFSRGSSGASKSKKVSAEAIKSQMLSSIEEDVNTKERTPLPQILESMKQSGKTDLEISRSLLSDIEAEIVSANYVGKNGETSKQLAAAVLCQLLADIPEPTLTPDQIKQARDQSAAEAPAYVAEAEKEAAAQASKLKKPSLKTSENPKTVEEQAAAKLKAAEETLFNKLCDEMKTQKRGVSEGLPVSIAMQTMIHMKGVDGNREKWKSMINNCLGVEVQTVQDPNKLAAPLEITATKTMPDKTKKTITLTPDAIKLLSIANTQFDSRSEVATKKYKSYLRGADESVLNLLATNKPQLSAQEQKKAREQAKTKGEVYEYQPAMTEQREIELMLLIDITEDYVFTPTGEKAEASYKEKLKLYSEGASSRDQTNNDTYLRLAAEKEDHSLFKTLQEQVKSHNKLHPDNPIQIDKDTFKSKDSNLVVLSNKETLNVFDQHAKQILQPHEKPTKSVSESTTTVDSRDIRVHMLLGNALAGVLLDNVSKDAVFDLSRELVGISSTDTKEGPKATPAEIDKALQILHEGLQDPTTSETTKEIIKNILLQFAKHYHYSEDNPANYAVAQFNQFLKDNNLQLESLDNGAAAKLQKLEGNLQKLEDKLQKPDGKLSKEEQLTKEKLEKEIIPLKQEVTQFNSAIKQFETESLKNSSFGVFLKSLDKNNPPSDSELDRASNVLDHKIKNLNDHAEKLENAVHTLTSRGAALEKRLEGLNPKMQKQRAEIEAQLSEVNTQLSKTKEQLSEVENRRSKVITDFSTMLIEFAGKYEYHEDVDPTNFTIIKFKALAAGNEFLEDKKFLNTFFTTIKEKQIEALARRESSPTNQQCVALIDTSPIEHLQNLFPSNTPLQAGGVQIGEAEQQTPPSPLPEEEPKPSDELSPAAETPVGRPSLPDEQRTIAPSPEEIPSPPAEPLETANKASTEKPARPSRENAPDLERLRSEGIIKPKKPARRGLARASTPETPPPPSTDLKRSKSAPPSTG